MPLTVKSLAYHAAIPSGKLAVATTKPCDTPEDLSLAYTPGVAAPCLAIRDDPAAAFRYTGRSNLVAVITNGTAVLGLGNIGPMAAKPVMEGKAVLFKRFADIDAFDLELAAETAAEVIQACVMLEPTFGGINLEDIKAPECFEIEAVLRERLTIPVFHDDQHGTAVIVGAALTNALDVTTRRWESTRVVISGAGASAIACARHLVRLGLDVAHLTMCDSHGVIYDGRDFGMNPYKQGFARPTSARTVVEALRGADVFLGLSAANSVPANALDGMARDPIVFVLANPDPDIPYHLIRRARPDALVATGRSDCPNQVNNLLGFPGIFRGALDTRASTVNDAMLLAATQAIARLAHDPVPASVRARYGTELLAYGRDYLIPKPFDPRVVVRVAGAVANAAILSGVAGQPLDLQSYARDLAHRLDRPAPDAV